MSRPRNRLGEIVRETRTGAGLDQEELASRVGSKQPRISDLEGTPERLLEQLRVLAAIDEACGWPRGHILRLAGYVDDEATDVEAAILADDRLAGPDQDALIYFYNFFRARSTAV